MHRPWACALSPAPLPPPAPSLVTRAQPTRRPEAKATEASHASRQPRWPRATSLWTRIPRPAGSCRRACRATNGIRDAAWFAQYERFEAPTDLGYTIKVINHEEDATGLTIPAPALCAIQDAASKSKLTVGICMLPIPAATNYHVLFHDKATGVALVTEEK